MEGQGEGASSSSLLGVLDSPAYLYLLTIFACYPLTYISRTYLHGQSPSVKHAYFIFWGLLLMFANFGYDVIHSAISIVVNYALLVTMGGTQLMVALSFIFNMGYLLTAYALFSTDGYDLIWTTPHCILIFKMIGTAFDLYDGQRKEEKLSQEQKELRLKTAPSLLEFSSYAYFLGGCFSPPVFPLRTYLDFTAGKLTDNDRGLPPDSVKPAFQKLGVSCVFIVLYTSLSPIFTNAYILSSEFASLSFPFQVLVVMAWGKCVLFKYSVIFLLAEGVCIMSGLAYNGRDENGNALWDGCVNFRPLVFELATNGRDLVQSHNITINTWLSRYIYKRLKFLNNRLISQSASLFFLAVWHGLYIGYYMGFAQEFLVFFIEAKVVDINKRYPPLARIAEIPPVKICLLVVFKVWNVFTFSYALIPFVLLRWRRTRIVYSAMHYAPLWFYVVFILLYQFAIDPALKKMERSKREAASKSQESETAKTK
ncbi:lysophospholipid acyltransferase 5-like [Patiria miniata]|uniref:Lysophospholipid acyltransferase 5 n=1 Tax=Patiria miniata TaxID=46514 RepID=A0A913Z148_PATMI|nr:lysophospholipid acyltransferase 5-like [Patiria miniata]